MSSNPNNPRNTLNKCPICNWCESVGFTRHLDDKIDDGDRGHRQLKESIVNLYDELSGPAAVANRLGIDKRFVKFVAKSEGLIHKKEATNCCPLCSWQGSTGFNLHLDSMVSSNDQEHISLKTLIIEMGREGIEPSRIELTTRVSKKLVITILKNNDARCWQRE